jgi:S-adenosylmethionine/arginine decarboxylase-like enzyme
VLASITVYPCGTVSEDSAVEIFVEGLHDLIP